MATTEHHLAVRTSHAIAEQQREHRRRFDSITRRAVGRFETRDWRSLRRDSVERIDLYEEAVTTAVEDILSLLGTRVRDKAMWTLTRAEYRKLIASSPDLEIAETFFNSVTRRIFHTEGVDPAIEFLESEPIRSVPWVAGWIRRYEVPASTEDLVSDIIRDCRFHAGWRHLRADGALAAAAIDRALADRGMHGPPERVDVVDPVFYRGPGAYIVGRMRVGGETIPFVLAIRHHRSGLYIGAVLLEAEDVSVLFSYTRSAFLVEVAHPQPFVEFLHSLMPHRRRSELYTSIGFRKHGKTELYRDLMRHIERTDERFGRAPGVPGLVMIVFTLPDYDMVFKVIRDRFPPQKQTTQRQVRSKYRIVSRHDRAGRLIDAQEFEHLRFPKSRFEPELLAELQNDASRSVSIEDDAVILHHVYMERQVTPLDVYLRGEDQDAALRAFVDYGTAIKNLAATNIFPGDMLIKNFGVTGSGRVVFYDYDELTLLTDCNFRRMPVTDDPFDEMAEAPWFGVGEGDVFPEELRNFLGVDPALREAFEARHGDLFDIGFWKGVQGRIRSGETIEIFPYRRSRALSRGGAEPQPAARGLT
jgi:isocitrate dehydrogenase kinase/phosphatase